MKDRLIEYVPGQVPVAGQPTLEDFLRREFQAIRRVLGDGGKFLSRNETIALCGTRNLLINGGFDFWQRGTSHSTVGYGSADRWLLNLIGSSATMSRQSFVIGQTDVPGEPKYYLRCAVTSVAGAANYAFVSQRIEDVRTAAGKTVTVSFYAKADAPKNVAINLTQYFGSAGSAQVSLAAQTAALTAGWQRFEMSFDLPSIAGKTISGTNPADCLALEFWMDSGSIWDGRTGSLGQQSGTFDFALVQVETGKEATAFVARLAGEELALCQRYYQKSYSALGTQFSGNVTYGGTYGAKVEIAMMRAVPTITLYAPQPCANFPVGTTGTAQHVSEHSFRTYAIASGTGVGFFGSQWTADAEL